MRRNVKPGPEARNRSKQAHPKITSPLASDMDVTRVPTMPHWQAKKTEQAPIWQYDSPHYEVESSLPSLSLVISEAPTQPPTPPVHEIDTVPDHEQDLFANILPPSFSSILPISEGGLPSSINTPLPPGPTNMHTRRVGTPFAGTLSPGQVPPERGWDTFNPHRLQKRTWGWERMSSGTQERGRERMLSGTQWSQHSERSGGQNVAGWEHRLNILDRLRWWLLRPGRIEFVLWLGGTILLICLTCALLLVTAFSLEWISPGQQNTLALQNVANTSSTTPDPTLTRLDQGNIVPGQTLHLHGQGFSPHAHIIFTYDTQQTALHQNIPGWAQPTALADAHGDFALAFTLGDGPAWKPGQHLLIAHDLTTHHFATLTIILTAKKVLATPVVSPTVTAPSSTGNPGSAPAPAPKPTAGITPTSTPKPPTPTPTPTPAATPTPTPGVTPTPTPATNSTPASSSTTATSSSSLALSASLVAEQDECDGKIQHCLMFNAGAVVWFLMLGYGLAVVLLVGAGVLRAGRLQR